MLMGKSCKANLNVSGRRADDVSVTDIVAAQVIESLLTF